MGTLVECILQSMIEKRKDLFGDSSTFLSFKSNDDEFDWTGGFNSNAMFGRVEYERDKKCLSEPVVLKSAPKVAFFKEFGVLPFINEILFFAKIIPFFERCRRIGHLFPKYYDSLMRIHPAADEAFIVFENLQASGYMSSEKKSFIDFDHLKLMLRKLGEFHAYSYQTKTEAPNMFNGLVSSFQETNFFVLRVVPPGIVELASRGLRNLKADPRYSSRLDKVEQLIAKAEDLMIEILTGDKENPISVVCHGDFLRSNVMFKYENGKPVDLKLVDMASWRLASPVVDLAHVLYLNASQQMRNEHWDDLIDEYYTALKETFPQCEVPSRESLLKEFERKSMLGYFVAAYFLPNLICADQDLPPQEAYFPDEFKNSDLAEIPLPELMKAIEKVGGELATESLADVLRDMMDRGFV